MKFICKVPNSTVDEILTYNDILDHIKKDNDDIDNDTEHLYKFCRITAHQGPLWTSNKDYKGSTYNVLVEWDNGETIYEPLDLITQDDPVTYADYAKQNNLLDTAGWIRFRRIANSDKKIKRVVNQAKLQNYRRIHSGSLVYLYCQPMHKPLSRIRKTTTPGGKKRKQPRWDNC
jgi:hypothetical protein